MILQVVHNWQKSDCFEWRQSTDTHLNAFTGWRYDMLLKQNSGADNKAWIMTQRIVFPICTEHWSSMCDDCLDKKICHARSIFNYFNMFSSFTLRLLRTKILLSKLDTAWLLRLREKHIPVFTWTGKVLTDPKCYSHYGLIL